MKEVYFFKVVSFPEGLRFRTDLSYIKIGQAVNSDRRLDAWDRVFRRHGYEVVRLGSIEAQSDRVIHGLLRKNLYLQCHMPTSKACVNIRHHSVTKEVFQIEPGELKELLQNSKYVWKDASDNSLAG